jgi:RNA polymerase sigma factor (sigma-70 family)
LLPAERLPGVTVKPAKLPFEQVVSVHGATVWRVCRAVLGPADADDAWSDTFLAALQAYPGLEAGANIEAWLVTIAHRKAVDVVRKSARGAVPMPEVPVRAAPTGADDRDLDLPATLAGLPDKQRFAVVYHYIAGLPYADVAAIIGGSVEAARRAAADGIANLRRIRGAVS